MWGTFFSDIQVNAFAREHLYNKDVVYDFCHCTLSLDDSEIVKLELKLDDNISLGVEALSFLAKANEKLPLIVDNQLNPNRRRLIQFLEEMNFNDEPLKMPHESLESFQSQFLESNLQSPLIPKHVCDYLNSPVKVKESNYDLFLSNINHEFSLQLWCRCIETMNFLEVRNTAFRAKISMLEGDLDEAEKLLYQARKINKRLPIISQIQEEIVNIRSCS
ncbi:hypothetical protein ABDK09_09555 [Vibrio sp. CDRSL-10 TSBA]